MRGHIASMHGYPEPGSFFEVGHVGDLSAAADVGGPSAPFTDAFLQRYTPRLAEAVAARSPNTAWDDPRADKMAALVGELQALHQVVSQAIAECQGHRRQSTSDLAGVVMQDAQTHHERFKSSYPYLGVERASMADWLNKQAPQRQTFHATQTEAIPDDTVLRQKGICLVDRMAAELLRGRR
jgi:hypothetical protein